MHPEGTARRVSWPYIEDKSYLWTWLFLVPLSVYTLWQVLYFLIVNVLRRQRLLRDPEVMTSYRYPLSVSVVENGIKPILAFNCLELVGILFEDCGDHIE